ncbi:diguanylate cyclase [Alishewanella longhuensis]
MKTSILHFSELAAINDLAFASLPQNKPLLVQAYISGDAKPWINALQQVIQRCAPSATVAGMTSYGQIEQGVIKQQGMSVFITEFAESKVSQSLLRADANEAEKTAMLQQLLQPDTKVLLIHSSDLLSRHANLLPLITELRPDIIVAGAVAQPAGVKLYSCVFNHQQQAEDAFLLTALHGYNLQASSALKRNWFAIGKSMQVTAAHNNCVSTIDDQSVVDLYQHYLGPGVAQHLPAASSMFPLFFDDKVHQTTAFVLKTTADGGAVFNQKVSVGQHVSLAFANMNSLLDNSYLAAIGPINAEQVFVFSCCVRLDLLKENILEEITPLAAKLPVCGSFGFGEMAMDEAGKAGLFSHCMSLLFLAEQPSPVSFSLPAEPKSQHERHEFKLSNEELLGIYGNLTRALMQDLTDTNNALKQLTLTDHLTGIGNRKYLDEQLHKEQQLYQRYHRPFSILLLDIDHFKAINDKFGHLNGDKVLIAVAKTLIREVRDVDIVGRWGGEEFMVICPDTDLEQSYGLAERLRIAILELRILTDEGIIQLTTSIGVAELTELMNIDQLLQQADKHLYQAKTQGRNQVL